MILKLMKTAAHSLLSLLSLLSALFLLSCEQGTSSFAATPTRDAEVSANAGFAIASLATTDCAFNNTAIITGQSITAYQNSNVPFGETCVSEIRSCDNSLLSGSYSFSSCAVAGPASCLFNGQTILHANSIEAYNTSAVDLGGECLAEMRSCYNGVLSGSNQYASCGINLPSACIFNGQTLTDGQPVSAYLSSSVAFGELCSVESRYCVDGALSGSHQYASCVVNQPSSCLFNGQTIAHGQSITAFLNSAVNTGAICNSEVRSCNNGVLSGVNQYASCVINEPASCLFNGQSIAHGASTTAYLSSNTTAGELCTAEERFCSNGELAGSHQYASCVMDQQASCLFNGQTIASGASVKAFGSSTVNFGNFCISQVRECQNGVLSGSGNFASCAVAQPASCLFNGQTLAHGQTVIGYQSSNVTDDLQCVSEVKFCYDGDLSGAFTNSSCAVADKNDDEVDVDDNTESKDKKKYCKKRRVEEKRHNDDKDDSKDKNRDDNRDKDHKLGGDKSSDNGLHSGWHKRKHKEHFDCGEHRGWYKEKKEKKKSCENKKDQKKTNKKDK